VGLLLCARHAGNIGELLHGRCPAAMALLQHGTRQLVVSSKGEQCLVSSHSRRVNTDLFVVVA